MVDHRRTLGESGCGYPYYVLNPPKIALVWLSWTWSAAAINGFSGTRPPSTSFQVYGLQHFFGCTVVDEFSGARSPLSRLRTYCTNRWLAQCWSHWVTYLPQLNIELRVWRTCKQFVPFPLCNWCLMHKPTWIISWTVNYCFRKLIINHFIILWI